MGGKKIVVVGFCAVLMSIAGLVSQSVAATLTFDVLATGTSDPGGSIAGAGKAVSVSQSAAVISFDIYAVMHGSNGTQQDDGMAKSWGSIISGNAGLRGNIAASPSAPWNGAGNSGPGTQTDLHSDGDLDVGLETGFVTGPQPDTAGAYFAAGTLSGQPVIGPDAAGDLRQKIGSATFTLLPGATPGQTTTIQYIPHTSNAGGHAQVFRVDDITYTINGDGSGTGLDPNFHQFNFAASSGLIAIASPITVTFTPEPGGILVGGAGAVLLCGRRRR